MKEPSQCIERRKAYDIHSLADSQEQKKRSRPKFQLGSSSSFRLSFLCWSRAQRNDESAGAHYNRKEACVERK